METGPEFPSGHHWRARALTREQAVELVKRHAAGEPSSVLAAEYGVSQHTVRNYVQTAAGKPSFGERNQRNLKTKSELTHGGADARCELCGWRPPRRYWRVLQTHHIIPIAAGGNDDLANILLLCPNHHALSHAMFPTTGRYYTGPRDRDALIQALRDPEAYAVEQERIIRAALR